MKLDKTESAVLEGLREIPVIDAHEHLRPERKRISVRVDFFLLFSTYLKADLLSAGMAPETFERLANDQDMDLQEKWKAFRPFYPLVKYGSYARPGRIWLREVLGHDDLTEQNYKEVSAQLQEWNKTGLYDRVLREMCHIGAALVANELWRDYDFGLLKPLWRLMNYTSDASYGKFREGAGEKAHGGLDAYLDWMEEDFQQYVKAGKGGVGVKIYLFPFETPDTRKADGIFRSIPTAGKSNPMSSADQRTLSSVICDRALELAQKHHLTAAVHSGVWGDFRDSQPTHLIPLAMRYPGVSFDLFHLGAPYVREAVMVGKMFPNVSLNLCWTTLLSPELTVRMLDECVDLVPMNNIIVFGGDYGLAVEKVYGHLKMTKEVVAKVLATRIRREEMDLDEALSVARMWFHDNAVRIYHL